MLIEWDRAEFFSQWNTGWNGTTGGSAVLGFWLTSREAVDDLYSDLTGAGHNGHQPPYDAFWGGRYAIVEDPDGNSIGLMGPTDPTLEYWPPNPPPQATSSRRAQASRRGPPSHMTILLREPDQGLPGAAPSPKSSPQAIPPPKHRFAHYWSREPKSCSPRVDQPQ